MKGTFCSILHHFSHFYSFRVTLDGAEQSADALLLCINNTSQFRLCVFTITTSRAVVSRRHHVFLNSVSVSDVWCCSASGTQINQTL